MKVNLAKFLCLIFAVLYVGTVCAENVERTAESIYQEVLSPFCPGRALQDCPSKAASDLKLEIKSELEAGKSKEQVLDNLYKKFGDSIRAVPPFAGFGIFAWITPIVFLVLVGAIMRYTFFGNKGGSNDESVQQLSEQERRKLRES